MAALSISVWDQVTKGNSTGQSSWEVTCNHCGHSFVANATKIKKHLLASGDVKACSGCPEHVSTALRTASAAKAVAQDSKKRTRDLQEEMDQNKKAKVSGSPSTLSSRQGSSSQGGIQRAFARANTASVQAAVAKFFYTEGIPFQKVESSSFKAMVAALQEAPGFVPPRRRLLAGRLLEDAVEKLKGELAPFDARAKVTGITISSDGWKSADSRPLLNVLATNSKGVKFVDAVDTTGHVKDGQYIADQLITCIEKEDSSNVVQVVTDGAASCTSAGRIIETRFPHIIFYWSTYDYIHNKKRNRLGPERARDLVYVFSNQRLVDKGNQVDDEEDYISWAEEEEDAE